MEFQTSFRRRNPRREPPAKPTVRETDINVPAYSAYLLSTLFGPYIMQSVEKYPLVNPRVKMKTSGQKSLSKIVSVYTLGFILQKKYQRYKNHSNGTHYKNFISMSLSGPFDSTSCCPATPVPHIKQKETHNSRKILISPHAGDIQS